MIGWKNICLQVRFFPILCREFKKKQLQIVFRYFFFLCQLHFASEIIYYIIDNILYIILYSALFK